MMMTASPFTSAFKTSVHVESDVVPDLARWLRDRLVHGCVRVSLLQRVGDLGHQPVEEWSLAELDDTSALAQVIYATGVRDAQATREALTFGLFAFRGDRPEPYGRYMFRIDAGQGGLEPPKATNDERMELIRLLMGHTDLSARLALGHSRGVLDQYERMIDQSNTHQGRLLAQAHTRIAALEAREIEALELRDKLQSFALQRDVEAERNKRRDENLRYTVEKVSQLAPLLLAGFVAARGSRAAGAPSAEPSAEPLPPVEELLVQFVSSLTAEQATGIGEILRPDQLGILAQLFQLARAKGAVPTATVAPDEDLAEAPTAPRAASASAAPSTTPAASEITPSNTNPSPEGLSS